MTRYLFAAALLLLSAGAALAEHPFVVGYERFARKAEAAVDVRAGGEVLLTELSCTACHKTDSLHLQPKRGPVLDGLGLRLNADYLRRYLRDPQAVKPGATMPKLLAHLPDGQRDAKIEALVHFLLAQKKRLYPPIKRDKENDPGSSSKQRGFMLFHRVGCVACHAPDASHKFHTQPVDAEVDEDQQELLLLAGITGRVASVPLGDLNAKYTHLTLSSFLHDPLKGRPAGRMPKLQLSMLEAADIAHYLLGSRDMSAKQPFTPQPKLVAEGQQLFVSTGCANCHTLGKTEAAEMGKPLHGLGQALANKAEPRGCLSQQPGKAPHYGLRDDQRAALRAAIQPLAVKEKKKAGPQPLAATSPALTVQHTMTQLNCYACHRRDTPDQRARGGPGERRWEYFETVDHVDIGDEGRIPPLLSEVGAKLTTAWMKKVLTGEARIRPHMHARMPVFGASTASLPGVLAKADGGVKPRTPQEVFTGAGDAEAGRALLNLGCIQCHSVQQESLAGVTGVDLTSIHQRINPQWFRELLLKPGSKRPRTRMPEFFPGGKSTVPQVLGGDTEKQIAALWAYLAGATNQKLPARIEAQSKVDFELKPAGQPVTIRTFMKEAGTHAIATGFPQGVHYAFDADEVRLALAWKGRFLDAHGTWFNRFAPPADPLGDKQYTFAPGGLLAEFKQPMDAWPTATGVKAGYRFRGYKLDKRRVPTLLYDFGEVKVSERIEPVTGGLRRTLELRGNTKNLWLRIATGKQLQIKDGKLHAGEATIEIRGASLQLQGEEARAKAPVQDGAARIEILYRW